MLTVTSRAWESKRAFRYGVVAAICASSLPLLVLPSLRWLGWGVLGITALVVGLQYTSQFGKHMLLLIATLALLGVTRIDTDISYGHLLSMGVPLLAVVVVPYVVTRYVFKEPVITFPFRFGRRWYKKEIAYVLFAGVASYLILPFYLVHTGSYHNWEAVLDPSHIVRLFIGTNALGIWDELFFVGVCLALLRQHIPFVWANIAQAMLWTAFLYELGFRGWGPFVIFLFALSQGYIFKRSKSLLYILTVHLTIDFVLFLTLVHLHNPGYLRIFITSPF